MTALRISILTLVLFVVPLTVRAAPKVNNGGGGWLCHDKSLQTNRWIVTVDLFEARENLLTIPGPDPSFGNDAWAIYHSQLNLIKKSIPQLEALLERHPLDLQKAFHLIDSPLDDFVDSDLSFRPAVNSCAGGYIEYIQIADFLIDGNLIVSSKIWSDPHFSSLERAALLLHEHLYWVLRQENDDQTSWRTRAVIGTLFSNEPTPKKVAEINQLLDESDRPTSPNDSIARFPVYLKCWASAESPFEILQVKDWRMNYGDHSSMEFYGFTFTVASSSEDGVPVDLSIENKVEKLKASLGSEYLRPIFMSLKYVNVQLSSAEGEELTARLSCQSTTED